MLTVLLLGFALIGPFARTILAHGNEVWQEYSYLGGMDAIALGCLAALLSHGRSFPLSAVRVIGALGSVLLIFLFGGSNLRQFAGVEPQWPQHDPAGAGHLHDRGRIEPEQLAQPRKIFFGSVVLLGERSYEIYLTHMFVVFILYNFFAFGGKPLGIVPVLFVATIFCSAVLGDLVARFYSEPMNWLLRRQWYRKGASDSLGETRLDLQPNRT